MNIDFSELFEKLVSHYGDKEALINLERNRRYSFTELHRLSNRIANMMRDKLQLKRGDCYLSILENDNLSLLHLWTSLKAEATSVWTNYRDSKAEHNRQIELTRPKVVFIERALLDEYADMLSRHEVVVVCMDPPGAKHSKVYDFWALLQNVSDRVPGVVLNDREDTVLLRFTGGTTGKGKCAAYTLDNWMHACDAYGYLPDVLFTADTRYLHIGPISHGSGIQILPTLLNGGCTVTMNTPDLNAWGRYVHQEAITTSMMVPTLLYRLLDSPTVMSSDLSSLKTVVYGAAPMAPSKLEALQAQFGNLFVQVYAATENLAPVTYLDHKTHQCPDSTRQDVILASCGKPTPSVEIKLVDNQGQAAAVGKIGEIWIRSRSTITQYFNNPEASEAEFTDGYWRSGDLARRDEEGYLYIVDRCKDMIISGGFNIYASEVEATINAHPAVTMSAVIGVPHEEWGEVVHADVVLKEWCSCDAAELQAYVKEALGGYKAPKSIDFVNDLPLSAVGKVLHRQVKERYFSRQVEAV
ncbi:long-chain fatty acid--CoA ligase [Maricurvus nonylphenolicus]|uniref:class I adenylate-forming enzyme family protein n=1 Tax=Maricurvus nonylphenolicus TaxID=1008307 RepID=UPI0036F44D9B